MIGLEAGRRQFLDVVGGVKSTTQTKKSTKTLGELYQMAAVWLSSPPTVMRYLPSPKCKRIEDFVRAKSYFQGNLLNREGRGKTGKRHAGYPAVMPGNTNNLSLKGAQLSLRL